MEDVSTKISAEEVARYEQDGAICLRGLFNEIWIDRLRSAVDETINNHSDGRKSPRDLIQYNKIFDEFNRTSPAASIAKTIMNAQRVHFYFDQIFFKEPREQSAPTPWHHDMPFWPIQGNQVCTIWLALDHVTSASSGMEYVAGSHRWGKFFRPPALKGSDQLGFEQDDPMPDIEAQRSEYTILSWDMAPGDCLVHHGLSVHMAGSNLGQQARRRALVTRWFGEDATYRAGGDVPLQVPGLKSGDPMPADRFFPVEPRR